MKIPNLMGQWTLLTDASMLFRQNAASGCKLLTENFISDSATSRISKVAWSPLNTSSFLYASFRLKKKCMLNVNSENYTACNTDFETIKAMS
jgi:hypothetical protein